MQTLERSITDGVRSEVDNVVATDETRVNDTILAALDSSVITGVELGIKLVNASPAQDIGSVVIDPDQMDFSGKVESFQMNASSRLNSNTDLNSYNEIGIKFVEAGDFPDNKRNFYRNTCTHQNNFPNTDPVSKQKNMK